MTDSIVVAIIGGTALVLSRISSRLEHERTHTIVQKIYTLTNSNTTVMLREKMILAKRLVRGNESAR